MTNEQLGDPKCWCCGAIKKCAMVYSPNICLDCLPDYQRRKFVFNRPSQEEMEELFSTNKGMTCQ